MDVEKITDYIQLRRERTEERRKVFQLADKRRRGTCDGTDSNFTKWNKLLESVPEVKSSSQENSGTIEQKQKHIESTDKGFFSKLLKKASKSSNTSEEGFSQLEKDQDKAQPSNGEPQNHKTQKNEGGKKELKKNNDTGNKYKGRKSSDEVKIEMKEEDYENSLSGDEGRPREDSIASHASSLWSTDNIPVIKIIESGGEKGPTIGSKSSSSDTVIAVGMEDRKRAPLARSKLNSDDLSEDLQSDNRSESSYQDMTESIRKIHSLTNVIEEV